MSYAAEIPRVVGGIMRNPQLRCVVLAFAGFTAAEWGVWIAMLVYAYDRGGATTAGLVALAQLVPAMLFAPFTSSLADSRRPTRVLTGAYLAQSGALGATAVVLLADGPAPLAYAFAAVAATAVTATRPAQAVLLPALARTPEELTGANVVAGWIESISVLVAPALAGLLLAVGGAGTVFAVMAAVVLVAALLVAGVPGPAAIAARGTAVSGALEGLWIVAREPGPRALVWLLGVEAVAIGALDVLYVVLAIGTLHHGGSTAGYLNAAFGAGGVLGIVVTVALVGRARLGPALIAALALWAIALVGVGVLPSTFAAFALLAVAGVGRTVVDVAGRTLLQRIAPPETLARVFGLLEAVSMAGLAVGSALAPIFVALAGGRWAFVCVGAVLPAGMLVVLGSLLAADNAVRPVVEIARLRALPIFSPLGPSALEALARSVEPVVAAAGMQVITEGEVGDAFYLVADGELEVTVGEAPVRTLGRGDCFGEIALLRRIPRTATVTARTDCRLDALGEEAFLAVLTGHPGSARAAEELVQQRLEGATITS
jgi:MFS family permease